MLDLGCVNDVLRTIHHGVKSYFTEFTLHVATFAISSFLIVLCLILLLITICCCNKRVPDMMTPLSDRGLVVTICLGCIIMALSPLPRYALSNPVWQRFEYLSQAQSLRTLQCFLQLGLFHIGFCIVHATLLLGIYRLVLRQFKVQYRTAVAGQMLRFVIPCVGLTGAYLTLWFLCFPHSHSACMTTKFQDYLFIVECSSLFFSKFLLSATTCHHMRPITKVVSVSLILSVVLGIAIFVARVILDGQLTDAWTSLLAAAHVLVYVLFLIAGTIVVRMKTACSQRRLHRKVSNGSLHQTNTRESCSLDSPGDSFNRSRIFYPSDFAMYELGQSRTKTESLTQVRRLQRRLNVPSLPVDPDALSQVWY